MFHRQIHLLARAALASGMLIAGSTIAWATDAPAAPAAPTKAMREHMALMHEQMAACLRSEKSVADCHAEMMKSCQAMAPGQGCGMGRGMGMGQGMGQGMGSPMNAPPPAAPTAPAASK